MAWRSGARPPSFWGIGFSGMPPTWKCRGFRRVRRSGWTCPAFRMERKGAGVRLYWELIWLGFRRTAAYRTAAISGAITNTFFGFLRAYVFIALYQSRPDAGGYSLDDALTF